MHTLHTRVRFGETDLMGVVYHPHYLVYFEMGRTEYFREYGLPYTEVERQGWRLVIVDVGLQYKAPARYDEEIEVETRLLQVSAVRLRFEYVVRLAAETSESSSAEEQSSMRARGASGGRRAGTVLTTGHTTLASVGHDGRPRRIPQDHLEALTRRAERDVRESTPRPQDSR